MVRFGKHAKVELPEATRLLVQVHMGEYNGIVTRISRFMALQFAVWPLLIVILTFIGAEYSKDHLPPDLAVWGAVFAVQFASQNYNFALYEVYNHVGYIEHVLKPRLVKLLDTESILEYERYLNKTGKAHGAWIGDTGPAIGSLATILLAAWWRREGWGISDFIGLATCGVVLFWVCLTSYRIVAIRRDFFHAA